MHTWRSEGDRAMPEGLELPLAGGLEAVGAGRPESQLPSRIDTKPFEGPPVPAQQLLGVILFDQVQHHQDGGHRLQLARGTQQQHTVHICIHPPPPRREMPQRTIRHLAKNLLRGGGHHASLPRSSPRTAQNGTPLTVLVRANRALLARLTH